MIKCVNLADIDEALDCTSPDNMAGIVPSLIFGYWDDVATWPDYPVKTTEALAMDAAGVIIGDVVMTAGAKAYKMAIQDGSAEFKITGQGEPGGESFLYDLNVILPKLRKAIFGFENATKGRKMFFIVTDNNGVSYLMGDKRRGAEKATDGSSTTGAKMTDLNKTTLHYTFSSPRKCVYEGDTKVLLTAAVSAGG